MKSLPQISDELDAANERIRQLEQQVQSLLPLLQMQVAPEAGGGNLVMAGNNATLRILSLIPNSVQQA